MKHLGTSRNDLSVREREKEKQQISEKKVT